LGCPKLPDLFALTDSNCINSGLPTYFDQKESNLSFSSITDLVNASNKIFEQDQLWECGYVSGCFFESQVVHEKGKGE
jgi:hypothetical protein